MLWLQRMSLKLNRILYPQNQVVQTKQRKHTCTHANTTLGVAAMSQARVLTERELRKILNFCSTQPHAARNRAMLLCTHQAGMRVGEVASLRICDVLGADGTVLEEIALSASQTKGNHSRTVLVPRKLRDEITTYLQQRFGIANLLAGVRIFYSARTLKWRDTKRKVEALPMALAGDFTYDSATKTVSTPKHDETAIRNIRRYLLIAQRLVENAAKGDFPAADYYK